MLLAHEPNAREHVEIANVGDLKTFIARLDREKAQNTITSMRVRCTTRAVDQDVREMLGKALLHPHSKIHRLSLIETRPNALHKSFATKHVKQWCKERPAKVPRLIGLW